MGCTQSRIENEEAVNRCKDRKQHLKEAVAARNLFAAAHSGHTLALKNTGAALGDYGEGEAEDPRLPTAVLEPPTDPLLPPPPPGPTFSPSPLARSVSMPDLPVPKPVPKPPETIREEEAAGEGADGKAEDTATPEPGTPLSPVPPPPLPPLSADRPAEPRAANAWDFFFPSIQDEMQGTTLNQIEEVETHVREEIKDVSRDGELKKKQEDEDVEGSRSKSGEYVEKTPEKESAETFTKTSKKNKKLGSGESTSSGAIATDGSKKVKKASTGLLQILNELDNHLLKASESGHEVSKMLEATRMHFHSNFADSQGNIDHSARVMRVITWSKPSTNTPNNNGMDSKVEWETHATVLDKLLAWEKKLYEEVKASELMKFEYQKKVALLNKHKKRGSNPEALERTKAAVSHLHTRYIVDIQSMDATLSEIHRLRDHELHPRLVDLVGGMAKMWEAMHMNHEKQQKIVTDLRALDISNAPMETSEQHHRRTRLLCRALDEWHTQFQKLMTYQKEYVQALYSWLKLTLIPIDSSLRERMSSTPWVEHPPIQSFLRSWQEQLGNLPFMLAKNAILTFSAVMNSILVHQEEELKQKYNYEETRNEYTRKHRTFEEWHQKYLQRKPHGPSSEVADPDRTEIGTAMNDPLAEKQIAVEALRKRLDDEWDKYQQLCKQVREKSYGSLRTHLPELFQALSEFANACTETYKKLQLEAQADGQPD